MGHSPSGSTLWKGAVEPLIGEARTQVNEDANRFSGRKVQGPEAIASWLGQDHRQRREWKGVR